MKTRSIKYPSFRCAQVLISLCNISKYVTASRRVPCGVAGCKELIEIFVNNVTCNQNKVTLKFRIVLW